MREILFRGKRIDTGEWVYGDLIHYRNNDYRILEQGNGDWDILEAGYKVDPATVGQFTGLCDKTGKWIFEGDIVNRRGGEYWQGCYEYDDTITISDLMDIVTTAEYESLLVIGNVHDEVAP